MVNIFESVSCITREMRELAEAYHDAFLNDPNAFSGNEVTSNELNSFANRIDESVKRETEEMREALEKIEKLTNGLDENCGVDPVEVRDIARAALQLSKNAETDNSGNHVDNCYNRRAATEGEVDSCKAKWCMACGAKCRNAGKDVLIICGDFVKAAPLCVGG